MKSVVFLDVDGVLNTRTTVKRTPYGYTGIDDARVKILANALKDTDMMKLYFRLIGKNWTRSIWTICILSQSLDNVD